MKNIAGKTRSVSNPYASWTDARSGWKYKLLKSWQGNNNKPYARWFVDVEGFGHDVGDEYVDNLLRGMSVANLTFDNTVWESRNAFVQWTYGE